MNEHIVILGGGGHACVVLDVLLELNLSASYLNPKKSTLLNIPYLGSDDYLEKKDRSKNIMLINGVGSTHLPVVRKSLYLKFKKLGYLFYTLIHPTAYVSKNAIIHEGAQIMAGCVIQTGCVVGQNAIVNTGVRLDHHTTIGAHTHITPGCTVCGNVYIGETSHIGPNSTLIQGVTLEANSFIPAHSLVKEKNNV